MRHIRVSVLSVTKGRFFINVPLDGDGKEMRQFQKEFIRLLETIESPPDTSRVKKKVGIYVFEVATGLSIEQIEDLANQALLKILKKKSQARLLAQAS
jgi:hypothetical protein